VVRITPCQEKDANQVWIGCVDRLEDLLVGELSVLLAQGAARNKVRQPQGVEGRELFDLVRLFEPILPIVEVFVVNHPAHALHKHRNAQIIKTHIQIKWHRAAKKEAGSGRACLHAMACLILADGAH